MNERVIRGESNPARPMCDSLRKDQDTRFSPLIASYREIDLDTGDIWGLVTEIHAVRPQIVIVLGYQEFARDLLEELKERAAGTTQKMTDLKFVMSDACFTDDLTRFGSEVYVTSPIDPAAVRCGSDAAKMLTAEVHAVDKDKEEPTDESYTFDAVLILASAVKGCEQSLDRRCIIQFLETNHDALSGACEKYFLDKGERKNASYRVYHSCPDHKMTQYWSVHKGNTEAQDDESCSKQLLAGRSGKRSADH